MLIRIYSMKKPCFVTPLVDSEVKALDQVVDFWKELGMEVATVSPEEHRWK